MSLSVIEAAEDALLTIELSGPSKLFVVRLPPETSRAAAASITDVCNALRLGELGHSCIVLYGDVMFGQMSDAELRSHGLMRILDGSVPAGRPH